MTITKNLLDCLEKKYLKPTIALAAEADDDNYREKLTEIEQILQDALDYVQTLKNNSYGLAYYKKTRRNPTQTTWNFGAFFIRFFKLRYHNINLKNQPILKSKRHANRVLHLSGKGKISACGVFFKFWRGDINQ